MLRFFCSILAFLVLLTVNVQAEVGEAHYAALHKNWPCDRSVKNLSILWNTFGDSRECVERQLLRGLDSIQIHLFNTVCVRNRNCGSYEVFAGYDRNSLNTGLLNRDKKLKAKVTKSAARAGQWLNTKKPKSTKLYVSPALEHNLTKEAYRVLLAWVQPYFLDADWVNNADNSSSVSFPKLINEKHHDTARLSKRCIANLDGQDIDFKARRSKGTNQISEKRVPAYIAKYSFCEIVYLWILEFNGRCQGSTFTDPRSRSCFPDKPLFKLVEDLVNE